MNWEEITPHINKLVKIGLKNKKRKTGWLLSEIHNGVPAGTSEIHCLSMRKAKKIMESGSATEWIILKPNSEAILIDEIRYIRSMK